MADKVLTVDVNLTSKFNEVKGKAQAGTLTTQENRAFFSNLNNTLIAIKKSLDQLERTMAAQQKGTRAPTGGGAKSKGVQAEERERQKTAKELENFRGKVRKGGTWIEKSSKDTAKSVQDLSDKTKKGGTWIEKSTKDAAQKIEDSGKKASKTIEKAADEQAEAVKRTTWKQRDAAKEAEKVAEETKKTAKVLTEAGKTANSMITESRNMLAQPFKVPKIDKNMAELDKMMARFGNSLSNLLTFIEKQARDTARRSRGGLEVLGPAGQGFKGTQREFKLEIADINALVKEIKTISDKIGETFEKRPGAGAEELFKELRARVARELRSELPSYEKQAQEVAKIMSREMGKVVKAAELMKDKTEQQLENLFDEKVIQAEFSRLRREVVKTLSIPRIQATPERGPFIEGRTGAQKGVIKFAEFETGLDRLINSVENNLKEIASSQNKSIKEVSREFKDLKVDLFKELTQPGGGTASENQRLLAQLLNLAVKSERGERLVKAGAARAIATGQARQAGGVTGASFEKTRRELEKLDAAGLNKKFNDLSDSLDISTKDIVKSLDRLNFQNIYDRILDNLKQEDARGTSSMRRFFRNLEAGYTSALRDFERGIGNVTGLLPQVAPNLPKSGVAARETVAVTTRAPRIVREGQFGEYVEERAQARYQPEVTQREIVGLNQALKSYFNDLAITGRLVNEEVQQLSTLGVSESVGAAIERLDDVHKVLFKMSALDLTKLGPFGEQFANAARAMSQTMRAIGGPQAEFPRLRSRTEQSFIEQGAFGQQGFGYNVVTELRHTADTFEDQVEIAGKLAKAVTETARKIVLPAGAVPESLTSEKIDKVGNEIIKLLGEERGVKFSADETFVKEIKEAATVVTGQDVDVQIVRIVEKFFAQWGRKITTRGSTKGLSTFPAAGQAAAGGAGISLAAEDLGIAKVPKTMGELAAELIENALGTDAETELKQRLIEAGNKFFIDIFSGTESVLGETEGKELQNLLKDMNKILGTNFKATFKGVENFRKLYIESLGETANAFKEMPIEARISLRGVAKRGVQSEILELLANNLTGAVETVLPDAVDLEKFLGKGRTRGVFQKYLKALGYLQEEGERLASYTEVAGKGGARKGLVGEKFLQVVEEPHLRAPWSPEDVESGLKGLRVNLQSFAALSNIFGEQSAYMDEISMASKSSSAEARELIMAMSLMGSKFDDLKPQLAQLIQIVDAGDLQVFERAAGTFEEMKGTILDFDKFAQAFVLSFPEAIGGGGLFVPGAAARKTYPEELTGGVGPGPLARKLDLVVDAAQKALEIAGGYGRTAELLPSDDVLRNFENAINKQVNILQEQAKTGAAGGPVSEKVIKESFKELINFLKATRPGQEIGDVPAIFAPFKARGGTYAQQTGQQVIQKSLGSRLGVGAGADLESIVGTPFKDIKRKQATIAKIYADIGRLIRDIVVGSEVWAEEAENIPKLLERLKKANADIISPEILEGLVPDPEAWYTKLREEKAGWKKYAEEKSDIPFLREKLQKQIEKSTFIPKVQKLLSSEEEDAEKVLRDFASAAKVEVEKFSEESLKRAQDRFARARAGYAEELSRSLFGKGKGVDVGFFQRQVPAARGQVINLNIDKIPDLEAALAALRELDAGTGTLSKNIEGLQAVIAEQKKLRSEASAAGRPFVREGEVLLPPKKAELLGDSVYKALKEGADVFVNTVRFPVTGAPSFQPAVARLMSEEMGQFSPTTIALPGRAPLDPTQIQDLIAPIQDRIMAIRDMLDLSDLELEKEGRSREGLVESLNYLKDVVENTTTKFAPFEQNLDFDGDTLFVHAAQTKEAAKEIENVYNALRGMDKDIFGVRQAMFSFINAIKEKDVSKIADVVGIFEKQFTPEKGFEILKRPGPRAPEDMTREEVVKAIGGFLGADASQKIAEKIGKNVADATEQELKDYLTDLKLSEDIIKLVGHKISIGQVTETMNRIARAAEVIVGGGGGVGGRGAPPMGGFLERWQPGAALGEDPAREFQFRLNELLRFGINSAFKTKHGGGSVYEELVGVLTTETGADKLRSEIEKGEGPFGDLAAINDAIQTTVKDRLRKFSLKELKDEAENLGVSVEGERKDIINSIAEKVDLPGFVAELFNVLKEAAIEAEKVTLIKGGQVGDVGGLARTNVEARIAETGSIDVRGQITEILQPLYQLRTGMTDLNSIFDQFGDVYEQNIPQWARATEDVTERMTKAKVAGDHLVQSMQDVSTGLTASGDAVTAMMQSYASQLLDILKTQRRFAEGLGLPTKPPEEDVSVTGALNKLLESKGLTDLLGAGAGPSEIKEVMRETFASLGLSDIPKETKDAIRKTVADAAERSVEAGEEVAKEQVALVAEIKIAEAQMKRIVGELQTLDFKELVARSALPGIEAFAGTPVTAPRGRRGSDFFVGEELRGGAMQDPKEAKKVMDKVMAEQEVLTQAAKESGEAISSSIPEGIKSWRDLEEAADASMQELEDAPKKATEAVKGAALSSKEFAKALKEDWDEWTSEADAEMDAVRREQDERMRKSLFDPTTGQLFDPEDVERMSSAERSKLTQAVSEAFSTVAEDATEKAEEGIKETTEAVQQATAEGVRSWVSKVKSATQAAGAGGAGGGDDGGDDDDFLKKLRKLQSEIDAALSIGDKEKKIERLQEIVESLRDLQKNIEEKDPTNKILDSVQAAINAANSLKVFTDPESVKRIAAQMQNVEGAVPTDSIIANLRELQSLAQQTHNLYDDIWGVPAFVTDVLERIRKEGPRGQFAEDFKNALNEANVSGVAETEAWKRYHLAKVEYHLRSAEQFEQLSIEADSLAKTSEFARRAGTSASQAQKTIKQTYRGASPYLTTQPGATQGVRGRSIDPDLAAAAGVIPDPTVLRAQISEYSSLRKELKPILDLLTEIDLDKMVGPLNKARTAFSAITMAAQETGDAMQKGLDLTTLTQDITLLRGAVEEFLFQNISASEVQRQNLRDTLFFLKDLEKQYARLGAEVVRGGVLKVPKWLQPDTQRDLHKRNLDIIRKSFAESVSDKGPEALDKVGQQLNYTYKVFDEGGTAIQNYVFQFNKLGDAFTSAGQPIGRFTEKIEDMNKAFTERKGIGQAFRRVILWGGAAAVVYGTINALQEMVMTISNVETAMVQLRKVMNPVVTDFEMIQRAGVDMAKNFGVPIENVIESMRVFAQQGLKQAEVLDRARTSTLAANVTVLSAQDATEALTSATKQFSDEGEGSIRFLDSWIETAARHAITSKDLALAMQRAGSAAKNAGINFNQLNALVTGIGVTTRQTGREIGTSIRFIARRLTAAKAPTELAKVGIQAFLPTGEVRGAFDIFDELAMKWKTLTQAQRLNIAQAIGGRRHYNSVLVLMKNWDETLEALTHSQNSSGSALRRNIIVMDTFNKKMEQLRQSIIETQLAFGKFALPVAKGLVDSIRFITERLSEIPDSIKIATLSLAGLVLLAHKGAGVIDRMADAWSKLTGLGNIGLTGGAGKALGSVSTALEGVTAAKSIFDVNSALGKLAFILVDVGRSYNAFVGNLAGSVAIWNIVKVATLSAITAFTGGAAALTGFTRVSSAFTIPTMTAMSLAFKSLSKEGTGLIGSLGPLAVTMFGLYNVMKPLVTGFLDANKTAADFAEERQNEVLQLQENIKVMNELGFSINKLSKAQKEFATGQAQITSETFTKNIADMRRQIGDLVSAQIPSAVSKFDEFGHAVLAGTGTLFNFAAGIKDVNEAALELEIGDQLARFNKELTATREGMEETKFQLRELIKDLPIFGDSIAKNIHVAPIIDLQEAVKTVNSILKERSQFPLTGAFEELYQEARENMLKARKAVEDSIDGMEKAFAKLPRGATTEEFVRTLRKYREELATLATFRADELQLDVDPEDILAVKAFERAGIKIEEYGELTHDAFIESGKKAKRAFNLVKADFEKEGKNIADAVAEGLDPAEWQFRSGDIVLFAKEYADQFNIAAGAALLEIRDTTDGMSQAVISFVDDATLKWTTIDFSDRIQQLVQSVFSPSGFKEAVAEGVDAANKILAGAAAGIKYPTPIDLGARFFSQVGTPEQLATGFGRQFGTPIGQTAFGGPGSPGLEFKETFEVDYKRFRKTLLEYEKKVEEVNKISQDGKIVEAELARSLADEISHLQRVIMNETAIANFRAVVIDLGKSFEEADRALQTAIQSERTRSELLRRPVGLFAGLPRNIPRLTEPAVTLDQAALEDVAFASSARFRELTSIYTEQNLTMDALVKRVTDLNQAQADLTYLKDLYDSNQALVQEIDFDRFVKDVAATGNKVAALQINATKGTTDAVIDGVDVAKEQLRVMKGQPEERVFDVDKMEEALKQGGGYVGAAIAAAAARREGAFGDPIADMQFSADETKKAADVFAYAAEKLAEMPLTELLKEYKVALREVGIGARGETIVPRGFDVQGTAITRLFATALGKQLGPQGFGDRFLKFSERIEKARKAEGPQLLDLPADVLLPFDDMIKQQVVTVNQLEKLFAVDVKAAANMDKLITQLGTFLLAYATRSGSQVAGAALGFGPGARIGEAIGIGRLGGGALGSFLGIQLADLGEDMAEQRDRIVEQLEKNSDVIQRAISPARPEGQRVEGFDALLSESQIQTEFLKNIAEATAKVPTDLEDTYDLLVKNRQEYATRQDIFSILKSVAATTGVAALAGLAGGPIERAALGTRTAELATQQFESALMFLLDNIDVIEKLAPEIGQDMDAAVEKFKAAVKDPVTTSESEIRDAFAVFEDMFQLMTKETGVSREQVIKLFKEQKLTQLQLAVITFQKKMGQQLLQIANTFKGADLARSVRNEYEAALTGFLKGLRFPGAIEPGRPAQQATAEERVFAAAPALYEGFTAGQERLQALSGSIQQLAQQMAVLDTQIKSGTGDTKLAASQYAALEDQQETLVGSANRLKDALGKMKETLDQAIVIERLRVSVQDMLVGLKKFNDVITEIDTTSIEMARREHPLAETPPAWGDRTFWRQGMDQFELEMARIRKEKGFLPFDERDRINWQKEEAIIQHDRGKELEKFNQEVSTAKDVYSQLYDFQQKWGLDVKGIMNSLASDLERAGDVVYRGGRKEFRGIPSLDNLQDRLADLAKEARDKQFKEQHDALMIPTETLLAASNVLIGEMNAKLGAIAAVAGKTESKALSTSDINLIIKQSYDDEGNYIGKQIGGAVSGPGGPMSDSIPAMLSDGEYVIRASSTSKLGTKVLDHINQYGEVPGFAGGGLADTPKAPINRNQRFESAKSFKEYDRNLRRYEREKTGFDPEQFIDSWAVRDAPLETKRNLLDSFSRVSGIKIRGLPQVLEAARRSGFKLLAGGGPANVGFGQSTIGDMPEFYRDLFNVSEIERSGLDYQEFRDKRLKQTAEELASRRMKGEKFIRTKRGFAQGGLASFLTQTEKRAVLTKADELSRRLSGDLRLNPKGNYVSTRSQFLEQVSELMAKQYVTSFALDNFIKNWEKSTGFGSMGGLKTALDEAAKTAFDVPKAGRQGIPGSDAYYGKQMVPGFGKAAPVEGFITKPKTYVGVMDTIAKAAAGQTVTQTEQALMDEALGRLGFYMENGAIKNYGMGGAVRRKRFAEGGGIGSALAPSTVRYEQQEKARQLAEQQKKQVQMYVDYLTGVRTDVPGEFDTVPADLLKKVSTHQDVGFTAEELKAIQDQGFSWYDIGNTYFEAMGGLIKRGMGGMTRRKHFQGGGLVEIDPEELSFYGGLKELFKVIDIVSGAKFARELVRTGEPILPEDIGREDLATALESKTGSIRGLTTAVGRAVGETGYLGGFDPESGGDPYTITGELGEQIAGVATDIVAEAGVGLGLFKTATGATRSAMKSLLSRRGTAGAAPEMAALYEIEPGILVEDYAKEMEHLADEIIAFEDFTKGKLRFQKEEFITKEDILPGGSLRTEAQQRAVAAAQGPTVASEADFIAFMDRNFPATKGMTADARLAYLRNRPRKLGMTGVGHIGELEELRSRMKLFGTAERGRGRAAVYSFADEPVLGTIDDPLHVRVGAHEAGHASGTTSKAVDTLGSERYKKFIEQAVEHPEVLARVKNRFADVTQFPGGYEGELQKIATAPGSNNLKLAADEVMQVVFEFKDKLPDIFQELNRAGVYFSAGGLASIPSFQGGGMMEEDGLAFLHKGEEVRTPAQQRADNTLKKVEIDTDAIKKAVEDGIEDAMKDATVKLENEKVIAELEDNTVVLEDRTLELVDRTVELSDRTVELADRTVTLDTTEVKAVLEDNTVRLDTTEVTARLDTDTVKAVLDTDTITVNVNANTTGGGADIEAFIENNNARLSALEGETEAFKITAGNNKSEIDALSQELSALDIENSVQMWNEIESLRTDVKNTSSELTGRFTAYDNQLNSLRRDLTENWNDHVQIQGSAYQARITAEKALARAMNSS